MNFFLTNDLRLINQKNQIIMKNFNKNIIFSIDTNSNYKVKLIKKKKSKDFEKYGDKIEFQKIELIFNKVQDLNLNIKVLFN